jgi:phytoene synthase
MPDADAALRPAGAATARVREGVPAGSLRHLAVLFSGSREQLLLGAIYAFEQELRRIVRSSAHEAAHARLQWWRGELDRLAAGHPTHPLGQALLPLRGRPGIDLSLLQEMLAAADLDLARFTYVSWRELDAYLFRSAGAAQVLLAATLAGARRMADTEVNFARQLGNLLRQAELLGEIDADLRSGRLYAPIEPLQAAGIDPREFAKGERTAAAEAFLAEWQSRVRDELRALPGVLTEREHRAAQRHGLVLAALLERDLAGPVSPAPGTARAGLPPLTRLWTAWRTALRHG